MKKHINGLNSNNNANNGNGNNKPNKAIKIEPSNLQSFIINPNNDKDLNLKNRDIILKNNYSATLKSSAENFLVDLFERISTMSNLEGVNLEVPISAAMAIITNTSWHQPSEAQMEYDFTRECIDKGLYSIQTLEEFELEGIQEDDFPEDIDGESEEDVNLDKE
jgi:hypothetical protein